jgi:beta-lactamase class A
MLTLALAVLLLQQVPGPAVSPLESSLRTRTAASGAEVAVAFRTLDGSAEVLIDPDKTFHAASTMKVPVMIELFARARAGGLALSDSVPIRNSFRSIVDGTPFSLTEGDESDAEIHAAVGRSLTYAQLCEAMITVSSNFATNLLIDRLGADRIQGTVDRLGGQGMRVLRGVEDSKAFEKGLNNSTTARGLLVLFERMGHGTAVDSHSDADMIEILKRQQFNEAIPAGVPAGTAVAHKTGNITRIHHDAGIVFAPRPYVLVLLVRGIEDRKQSGVLMAELSRLVFESSQGR